MCLAVPGQILEIVCEEPMNRLARVGFGGVVKEVNLSFLPEAAVGSWVVVHVGFAISMLDEAAARETLGYLHELGVDD